MTRIYPWLKKHSAALKLAVTVVLLVVALRMIRFDTLVESFRDAHIGWLAVAALILVLGGFAGSASWFCVLRLRLPGMRFRDAAAFHWIGMFFNSFLPSNVGGDLAKGYLIHAAPQYVNATADGQPPGLAFIVASVLIDRAANLSMLLGIGGFAWLFQRYGAVSACGALAGVAIALAGLVWTARAWLPRIPLPAKLQPLAADILRLMREPRRLFPFLLAAFTSQFLKTWSNVFVVLALGLNIQLATVWSVIPLFGLVSALPISVGGLGVRELVAQGLGGPLHVDSAHLVALSLAGHFLTVLVNFLGALPLIMTKRCPRACGGS